MSDPVKGPRALIVDDDEALLRIEARALARAGYRVELAAHGTAAVEALRGAPFDVIFSDIDMPEMNGIQFLEQVRAQDFDVPVVLVTGDPSVETAAKAIEHGALRYLVKPVALVELVKVADDAVRLHRLAKAKRQALEHTGGEGGWSGDHAGLVASFNRALVSLHVAFQPIVSWSNRSLFAYEGLLRTDEPALPHPAAVLDAAERLGRVHELGRRIRQKASEPLARIPENALLFVNLHPQELLDDELFDPQASLSRVAERIVLEVTERVTLHTVGGVRARVAALRKLGFRIAIDDLGAGYAGLTSFALLEPDVVKLDMSLIRGIDGDPTKLTLVRTMVEMCKELGMLVTGEGVETPAERDALARTDCDLMQGYLFAKPGPPFVVPTFTA